MSATDSEKKVLVGVDELTAVLMSAMIYADGLAGWEAKAEKMIKEFARLANLEGIFGKQKKLENLEMSTVGHEIWQETQNHGN